MTRALSVGLRRRVIAAVEDGASCRQAAAVRRERMKRDPLARAVADGWGRHAQGGDRRSARIEAHAAVILGALERKPDITLADLRSELADRGIGVSVAGLWRFFQR
jgi:transposase